MSTQIILTFAHLRYIQKDRLQEILVDPQASAAARQEARGARAVAAGASSAVSG